MTVANSGWLIAGAMSAAASSKSASTSLRWKECSTSSASSTNVEALCPTGPPGDELRRKLRDKKSRAIIAQIQQWALEQRALPQSGLGKAIAYMGGRWHGLVLFLEDARIPLDNNATERGLRGPVIGRKNHYGSRSKRGTEVAALLYSLTESAKLCGLEPKAYLRRAVSAALAGETIPLPHEMLEPPVAVS